MAELRCIGRTDSLGTPEEYGQCVGFVLEYPGGHRHTITLAEHDAEALFCQIKSAIWADAD